MGNAAPSYRRALRNRDFRLLTGALTQSAMGDWAYNVALIVYVYNQTHSAAWVSAGTLCRMVPAFFASAYGGVIAERFERIHVMISAALYQKLSFAHYLLAIEPNIKIAADTVDVCF